MASPRRWCQPPPPSKNWTEQCSQEPGTSWKLLALHLESLFLTPRSCYRRLHDHDLTVQCPTTAPPAPLVPRFISGERGAHFMDCYQKERSQYYVVLRHLGLCPPRLLQGLCDIATLGKEQRQQ